MTTFRFDEYTLRPAGELDRQFLTAMIDADPFHAGQVSPDFFLRHLPGEEGLALEDGHGRVVFYLKTQTACRCHIQFGDAESDADRARNRDALTKGLRWLEGVLAANNIRELVFDSENPLMIAHAKRRLGFTNAPDDFRRAIPLTSAQRERQGVLQQQSQLSEGRGE